MPRAREQRISDTRATLATAVDTWVATASIDGRAHLVPLSFAYVDGVVLIATIEASATARNVAATGRARLAFGEFRDVVMMVASATVEPWSAANPAHTRAFIDARGWDPSAEPHGFVLLTLHPTQIQAWRDVDEISGRDVMSGGAWLDG